jgi:hypothetical protein
MFLVGQNIYWVTDENFRDTEVFKPFNFMVHKITLSKVIKKLVHFITCDLARIHYNPFKVLIRKYYQKKVKT